MKKFGIFVIKPDAINKHDLSIIQETLNKYGFSKSICFNIDNYCELMRKYREADIRFKNLDNAEIEITCCNVALSAYQQLFIKDNALLLLVPLGKESFKDFFDKANFAKREIRKQIEEDRGYYYAYIDYRTSPRLVKLTHEEYKIRKNKDKTDINKAYINGIHLEDYECFESNFCLNFMVENGIIGKSNKVDINELIENLEV